MSEIESEIQLNETSHTTPVGEQIRIAREKASLKVSQLSEALKITPERITLIEKDEYEESYINIYFRGYIRNICKYLQLDAQAIFTELNRRGFNTATIPPDHITTPTSFKEPFSIKPKTILISLGLLILLIFTYLIFHNTTPLQPQTLVLNTPSTLTEKKPQAKPLKKQNLSTQILHKSKHLYAQTHELIE